MTEIRAADNFDAIAADRQTLDQPVINNSECPTCFDGGWECYGIGHHDPHFRECPTCHNPQGNPAP